MIPKRAIIVGGGSTIRQGLWDTPIEYLPIWRSIEKEFVISTNWAMKWCVPTVAMFVDYRFYCSEKKLLDQLPLVVGKQDSFFDCKSRYREYFEHVGDNLRFIKTCGAVVPQEKENCRFRGEKSWTEGFFCSQYSGLFALSFALVLGCEEIYLLGFDSNEIDGHTHFYQGDAEKTGHMHWRGQDQTGVGRNERGQLNTDGYNKNINWWFKPLTVTNAKIYNVSPNSNITVFPRINYEQFYQGIGNLAINQTMVRLTIENLIKNGGAHEH